MIQEMKFYFVSEMPSGAFDSFKIFELIGKQDFILFYDFRKSISIMGFNNYDADNIKNKIIMEIPGIGFSDINYPVFGGKEDLTIFSVYRKVEEFENRFFYDTFNIMKEDFLSIIFINAPISEVSSVKTHLEDVLSSKNVRETESLSRTFRTNSTNHRDLYYESEEKLMLNSIIESLNKSILSNGLAYKIFLVVPKASGQLSEYINTHFLVLNKYDFRNYTTASIIDYTHKRNSLPFGIDYAKEFINLYGAHNMNHTLPTSIPLQEDGIEIGKFLKDGVLETDLSIRVNPTAINLGFIITGLPGSGKTREAMSIMDSLLTKTEDKKPTIFIITPTSEWKDFALEHNMYFIELFQDETPINFFRCPKTIEVEKFYGNLAMILSSAANAGPYRNPMEKCMLNAFRKSYKGDDKPEPTKIYEEIEESIIRYHGKRTSTGIKYTKHGENIKSALENLRGILSMRQYCVREGIKIEDFLENGAVFDVSAASANTRAQLYALVLNQIYAIATNLDTNGDNELRLVLCLEEAQTIFGDEDSPAVEDIKQRIQDFRKQGIGLVLLTHNVNDIDVGIRRLCQLKLYLKQAPDTAIIAAKDLIFAYSDPDDVLLKLKTLSSRIGALSYTSKNGNEKRQQDTVFIRTCTYESNFDKKFPNPITDYMKRMNLNSAKSIDCKIALKLGDYQDIKSRILKDSYHVKLTFLGEEIVMAELKELDSLVFPLLEWVHYKASILNKNGRVLKEIPIKASERMFIDIKSDS